MSHRKYDNTMMETAEIWAKRSKCVKKKVGAVIAYDNNIIAVGYNGTPPGYESKGEYDCEDAVIMCPYCDSSKIVKMDDIEYRCEDCLELFYNPKIDLKTDHSRVVHAEANALMFAARKGTSTQGATLYVTLSPCEHCSLLIASAGIQRVVYKEDYKNSNGIKLLQELGIEVQKL